MKTTYKYCLIQRGKNGWHALMHTEHYPSGGFARGSSSGGSFEIYLAQGIEGAPVIDCDQVPYNLVAGMTICGPMPDPDLPSGHWRRPCETVNVELSGDTPRTLEGLRDAGIRSLSTVALDIFVDMHRAIGARIGVVKGGSVVWERGAK